MIVSSNPVQTINSPLKWAGSKASLLNALLPKLLKHKDCAFRSLFLGGGSAELIFPSSDVLVNDVDVSLTAFWRSLQSGQLTTIPVTRQFFEEKYNTYIECHQRELVKKEAYEPKVLADYAVYMAMRDRLNRIRKDPGQYTTTEHGCLFYAVSRNAFNGLWRTRADGFYVNSPFRKDWDEGAKSFKKWRNKIAHWTIQCGDWSQVVLHPGDVVYADPPYFSEEESEEADHDQLQLFETAPSAGSGFSTYSGKFDWNNHVALANLLAQHDGPVLLHNAEGPAILRLYQSLGFRIERLTAKRSISRTGDREPAPEIIATKGF